MTMSHQSARRPDNQKWTGCRFTLKHEWIKSFDGRRFVVYLERRVAGRYGRLKILDAVVLKRRLPSDLADYSLRSAKYRQNCLVDAQEKMEEVGVPENLVEKFMGKILKQYPLPTREEFFLDGIRQPSMKMILGKREKELSFFKTGVPELTSEDKKLLKSCMADLDVRIKKDPMFVMEALKVL